MAELMMLEKLFRKKDLHVTYGTLRRHQKIYQKAVEMANSGKFGRLLEISADFGAGTLAWCHPHSIDCILFAANQKKPQKVQAHLGALVFGADQNQIENDPLVYSGKIYFKDNLCGSISRRPGMDLVLSCEKAQIIVRSDGKSLGIRKFDSGGYLKPEKIMRLSKPPFSGSAAPLDFLKKCLKNKTIYKKKSGIHKKSIIESQKIIFAFIESSTKKEKLINIINQKSKYAFLAKTKTYYA
jgi:predicted dehydrogenase